MINFTITITILMFAFIGTTSNLALASSDEDEEAEESTTEFEAYTNPDYGFSIDYPSDWQEQETTLQQFGVAKFLADETLGGIDISIIKVEPNMSLYEIATLIDESKTRLINMTNTTLAGFPAVETTYYQYELAGVAKIKEAIILNENNLDLIIIRI